jgi:energy-coupling factor transport system permease protein
LDFQLYLPGESILHKVDPRLKIGGLVGLGLLMTTVNSRGLMSLSLGLFILLLLSQVPLSELVAVIYAVLFIGVFYVLILGWNGWQSWYFWQGHWSLEGVLQALILIWRIAILFVLTRIFTAVTLPSEQGIGIAYLLTPFYRITPKVADFALLITLTLRFIPLLIEEASYLYKARLAKGSLPSSRVKKLLELASFLIPLILISLRRAEELAENLVARGYVSGGYRVLGTNEWRDKDTWGTVMLLVWGIGTLALNSLTF